MTMSCLVSAGSAMTAVDRYASLVTVRSGTQRARGLARQRVPIATRTRNLPLRRSVRDPSPAGASLVGAGFLVAWLPASVYGSGSFWHANGTAALVGDCLRSSACKLPAPCRLLSFTWEYGLSAVCLHRSASYAVVVNDCGPHPSPIVFPIWRQLRPRCP